VTLFASLFTYLSQAEDVTDLLGSGVDCRIYDTDAEEMAQYPYSVIVQSGEEQEHQFGGLPVIRIIDITIETYAQSIDDARSVDQALYSALMGNESSMTDVREIVFEGRREGYDFDLAETPATAPAFVESDYRIFFNA